MLYQLPRSCRVYAAWQPAVQWSPGEWMANRANYLLELLVWQNSFNPKKKAEWMGLKPKPFTPDFMVDEEKTKQLNKDVETHTVDDIKTILAQPRH